MIMYNYVPRMSRGIFLRKEDLKLPSEKVLENKKAMVKQLTERLQNAQAGVLADYRGLTVEQDTELRRKLREANVEYTVLKNSIIRFAAKEVGLEDLDSVLEGPTAIATSNDDVISPAKVLCDFAKGNDLLEIKAGFVEGKVISIDEVKQYASIPSKEVLISKMMGSLQSPISKLARLIAGYRYRRSCTGRKSRRNSSTCWRGSCCRSGRNTCRRVVNINLYKISY